MTDPSTPRPRAPPAPTADDVRGMLAGVIDPELHASIVDLGHGARRRRSRPTATSRCKVALTTAGCPLRGQIRHDVAVEGRAACRASRDVKVEYGEMTQEQKPAAMQRARLNAREHARRPPRSPRPRACSRSASGKGGVGKSSVTVNLAAALAARGPHGRRARRRHLGLQRPAHARRRRPPRRRRRQDRRRNGKIVPQRRRDADGRRAASKVVSMGFLVDDEDTALMWRGLILTKALEQFLTDVRWGELDYLLIDMPPGTGDIQMGLARLLPQAEMLVVTTPAQGAQKVAARVADMARRSYMKVLGVVENMSEFVAPDGSAATRSSAAAAATRSPTISARRSSARSRSSPRSRRAATPASRSCSPRPIARRARRSPRSRAASSTSCSRRSRWPVAPLASSTWRKTWRDTRAAHRVRRSRRAVRTHASAVSRWALRRRCMDFGDLHAGDRALEVGAGTGKATVGSSPRARRARARARAGHGGRTPAVVPVRHRDDVRSLDRSSRRVLARSSPRSRGTGSGTTPPHTARSRTRSATAERSRCSGTSPREFNGALGADIQAVYRGPRPPTLEPLTTQWPLDETLAEIDASDRFDIATKVTVPWTQPYSRTEYVELMGTHSNHRMLDDATRARDPSRRWRGDRAARWCGRGHLRHGRLSRS